MLRRARQKNDNELLSLSLKAKLAHTATGRPEGAEAVSGPRTQAERFLVQDEGAAIEWGQFNQPWPRKLADGIFQRGIKRTLAMEHYEARGFYGPLPLEIYSTSPWHALAARRYLRPDYPEFLPYHPSQAIRIYHEPFGKFSDHWPRAKEEKLVLIDLRELRAIILGSLATEDLLHVIRTLARYQLLRPGFLPLSGVACSASDGSRTAFTFGREEFPENERRALISRGEAFWCLDGVAPLGRQAYPAQRIARDPSSVIFLCRDLHGGLPAAARLNLGQARYFFESGYGSAPGSSALGDFDPCYSGHSLTKPRSHYGQLFANRLARSGAAAWVVNAGTFAGEPVPAAVVEACVRAIQAGAAEGPVAEEGAGFLQLTPPPALAGLSPRWLAKASPQGCEALENSFRAALSSK